MSGTAALAERFRPVFAKIAEGALDREAARRLPYDQVSWLREAGFCKIRVPRAYGGLGASLPQFFRLLIELGEADSNLPQLLRGHFGFVENRLVHTDPGVRDRWLRRIAGGAIVGNAQSELGNRSFWENATTVTEAPAGTAWRLNGKKFYSTGSLFADWIHTTATVDREHSATVLVPASARGVSRLDDWDGFGQRLTGSGTTVFDDVEIHADDVEPYENGQRQKSYLAAFFQLVHLATLSGIGRAAVAEATAFVRQRARNLTNPAYSSPRDDPQVQAVVGRIAGASFAAEATTLAAVDAVDLAYLAEAAGHATTELFDRADATVYSAQGQVIGLVLGLVTELFEVGGASAVTERFRLDRHWRNARTLASHNPVIYRDRIIGDYVLNGTSPRAAYARSLERSHGLPIAPAEVSSDAASLIGAMPREK
jgi:alkylation response protein AidB-like acyl-CoA dehydrogenase